MTYPPELEAWWLKQARSHFHGAHDAKCLKRLEPAVQALSDLYTKERSQAVREIYDAPELRLAYGLFFFPQTYARLGLVLHELSAFRGWVPPPAQVCRIADLGCGLGASTLALVHHLRAASPRLPLEVMALDHNRHNLDSLSAIANHLRLGRERVEIRPETGDLKAFSGAAFRGKSYHLISASFSLGESFEGRPDADVAAWADRALDCLAEDGLLVLTEPALHETSRRLERLRDHAAARGIPIWAPCLHRQSCPLLRNDKFWCHEVRSWQPPASLSLLNRHLYRGIQNVKFSFLVLGRRPPARNPQGGPELLRLISPVARVPGRFLFSGCAADGESNTYDLQTRDVAQEERRGVRKLSRGDIVRLENPAPLKSRNQYRLASASGLEILHKPAPETTDRQEFEK